VATNDDSFGFAAALREAKALADAGRLAEAEAHLTRAANTGSPTAPLLRELAILALRRGDRERGADLLRQALAVDPTDWVSQANLGVALRGLGRFDEAVAAYDAALAVKPGVAPIWANRANALLDLDRFDDALASFDRAVEIAPDVADNQAGRARALLNLGRADEALACVDRAEGLRPGDAEIATLRGSALLLLRRPDEALAAYDAALAKAPENAMAHGGRAKALLELFYASDAPPPAEEIDASFDRARALDPGSAELAYLHSLMLMRSRRFEKGWQAYERRWDVGHFRTGSQGQVKPDLQGRLGRNPRPGDFDGRAVLLASEQGVGDDIMFASMIPEVMARAASVALICDVRLHRLFASSFPGLQVIAPVAEGGVVPPCDLVVALGSLGHAFRNTLADFPGKPYLLASEGALARWADWLGPRQGLRVGISWRGGRFLTEGDRRSMTLETLRPLLSREDCEFVNLQYGPVAADLAEANQGLPRPIRAPAPAEMSDFDDLAGLVLNLDLIVSVQTALVHLSGALGAPCLTMIPRKPEWRYGADGETMPWYGSVRLLRQGLDGEWGPVVARVVEEVARRAAV
jgi:tetratricopeptide (TPR) repeat protein